MSLEIFALLPKAQDSLNCCCPELVLSASGFWPRREEPRSLWMKHREKMKGHTALSCLSLAGLKRPPGLGLRP